MRKIMFKMKMRNGEELGFYVNSREEMILKIAEMIKLHGRSNIRVLRDTISISSVRVLPHNTIFSKAA
jgi:adenylylsulfate kinase-like enzyme